MQSFSYSFEGGTSDNEKIWGGGEVLHFCVLLHLYDQIFRIFFLKVHCCFWDGRVHVCYISLCDYLSKENLVVLYRSIKDENWRNFVLEQLQNAEEQASLCVHVGRQELV